MKNTSKVSKLSLFSIVMFSVIIYSCTENSQVSKEVSTDSNIIIQEKLGYIELKTGDELNVLSNTFNSTSNIKFFKSDTDNSLVVLKIIGNKYYLDKGIINGDKFLIRTSFELIDNMNSEGEGSLTIKNITEGISLLQKYKKGVFENEVISKTNNLTAKSLCQREKGENFKECFSRETGDFCDDFISTVAYITNPSIAVLIAALCSC